MSLFALPQVFSAIIQLQEFNDREWLPRSWQNSKVPIQSRNRSHLFFHELRSYVLNQLETNTSTQTMKLSFALIFLSVGADGARVGSTAKKALRQHQHQPKGGADDVKDVNLDMQKELFGSWVTEHKGSNLNSAYKNPEDLTHRMNIWMQNHGTFIAALLGPSSLFLARDRCVSFFHDRLILHSLLFDVSRSPHREAQQPGSQAIVHSGPQCVL